MTVDDPRLVHESLVALLRTTPPADLLVALDETGWLEMYAADAAVAVGTLFAAQAEVLASSPMLAVLLAIALVSPEQSPERFPAPALLPPPGTDPAPPATLRDDGSVRADGCLLGAIDAERVITAVSTSAGTIGLIEFGAGPLDRVAVDGLDPSLQISRVTGTVGAAGVRVLAENADEAWNRAVALCRLAISHELTATAQSAVALAVEHAKERVQFGQPIGAFQAVQHRLADATVAVEVASLALDEGWRHRAEDTAALAKTLAGRAARQSAKHAQQVLGGMGFSWEHPFHGKLRRMLSLDLVLGSCTQVERELGTELLRGGGLPELRAL